MIFDWLSQDERYKIHDAHLAQFKDLYERTGLVEDHPAVGDFPFIKGSHLLTCPRLPEYRDVRAKLKPLSQIQAERHFVSHRWLSPSHPDPDGKLLRVLKEHVDPDVYYWIDFSCLPQKPRTEREETLFRSQMHLLPSLMFRMGFIAVRTEGDGYLDRAWCFFELLAAHVLGGTVSHAYENPELSGGSHADEQSVLEGTLATRSLPAGLGATDPADMRAIQDSTGTVVTFSLVNLVSHYMGLGQHVSDMLSDNWNSRLAAVGACACDR